MTEHYAPLREVRRWMRVSTPVNKAAASGLRGQLPQIAGPLVIGALGVGAIGAGIAWRALASTRGTGRTQRFAELASSALEAAFPETFIDEAGASYVAFRGTNGTAVGWAEDAQFGLDFPTIAQLWAARYLLYVARRTAGPVTVIGHSKGGNLALYAAAATYVPTLQHVFSFDPVGFPESVIDDGFFSSIAPLTSVYTPAESWVSPLFPLPTGASIIASLWRGPLSHNPYTWLIAGSSLLCDSRNPSRSGAALGGLVGLLLRVRPIRVVQDR